MKVLIVNTSEQTGGAAVAASRLMDALNHHGVKAKMLVRDRSTHCLTVSALPPSWLHRWYFLWERLVVWAHLHFRREHLFEIDIANCGTDITGLPEFKEADVIHLHWINQGMLSLNSIRKILESGKPVVWTMHDLWAATAICHYARGCRQYTSRCSKCELLPSHTTKNLALQVWNKKRLVLQKGHVFFVACSRWLEGEARKSALLKEHSITNIPNAIDTKLYRPTDKAAARRMLGLPAQGHVLLFVSQRVTDERKGVSFLIEAIDKMVALHPDMKEHTTIALLGGKGEDVAARLALPVHPLGYVTDVQTIVSVYNAADVFVTPSLEDNLPNTVMEAMACGVPCVGFRVGGIPEMIDHQKTGYVADYRNSDDLARGLAWLLNEADARELGLQAVRKVAQCYSQSQVALRYSEVYQQAMVQKHLHL